MDVPEDEDGLIAHIVRKFNGELEHYIELDARYEGHKYPDQLKVRQAISLVKDILSQQKDNLALIQRVIDTHYHGINPFPSLGEYAGLYQQYMFCHARLFEG